MVSLFIDPIESQIKKAKEVGAYVSPFEESISTAKNVLKEGGFQKALALAVEAGKSAEKAKGEHTTCLEAISIAEKDLERAKALGAVVAKVQTFLIEAKSKLDSHDYKLALDAAKRCSEEAHQSMAMFVDAALMNTMAAIVESEQTGVNIANAREFLENAKKALLNKEYENAIQAAVNGKTIATERRKLYQKAQEVIQKAKLECKSAEMLGADTALVLEHISIAENAFSMYEYDKSISNAEKAIEESHTARATVVTESILAAEGIITECKLSKIEVSNAENMLAEARKKLDGRLYQDSMNIAMKAGEEAENRRNLYTNANSEIKKALIAIEEAKSVGADVTQFTSWLERAKELLKSNLYENAIKQATDCFNKVTKTKEEYMGIAEIIT
ncbi:MAG: hypothetical protein QXT63_09845, partial [Thermoplasmata archaeon]